MNTDFFGPHHRVTGANNYSSKTSMDERLKDSMSRPLVLLFGPLALSFDHAAFIKIRDVLAHTDDYHWLLQTIVDLPQCLNTISAALPVLQTGTALKALEDMRRTFLTEQHLHTSFPLPNTLLIPLIVVSQLMQYISFLRDSHTEHDNWIDVLASKQDSEALGLCTGFLSALAVSSAKSKEQFRKYGAVAVRLGMLIGVVVDAQNASSGLEASKSLTAVWNTVDNGKEMAQILKKFSKVSQYNSKPPFPRPLCVR